jgi:hypothetical protein
LKAIVFLQGALLVLSALLSSCATVEGKIIGEDKKIEIAVIRGCVELKYINYAINNAKNKTNMDTFMMSKREEEEFRPNVEKASATIVKENESATILLSRGDGLDVHIKNNDDANAQVVIKIDGEIYKSFEIARKSLFPEILLFENQKKALLYWSVDL